MDHSIANVAYLRSISIPLVEMDSMCKNFYISNSGLDHGAMWPRYSFSVWHKVGGESFISDFLGINPLCGRPSKPSLKSAVKEGGFSYCLLTNHHSIIESGSA